MNNAFLGKTMEKLVREPNHYITKIFICYFISDRYEENSNTIE